MTVDDHRQATSRVTTSRNTEELHVTDDNTPPIGQQPDGFMVNVPAYDVQTSHNTAGWKLRRPTACPDPARGCSSVRAAS